MMALMAASRGAPPPGQPQTIQVRPQGPPQQGGGDPTTSLKAAISAVQQALQAADDPIDQHEIAKCLAALQGVLAAEQKEKDQAMGGKLSPRVMRKASSPSY